MKVSELIKDMIYELGKVAVDAEKFEETGSGPAGTRVRKGMQQLKASAQQVRESITAAKKDSPEE